MWHAGCSGSRVIPRGRTSMNTLLRTVPVAFCLLCVAPSVAYASNPMLVYARVDSVTFEPSEAAAVRIRIDGVFALHKAVSTPNYDYDYGGPFAGYVYYACPAGQEANCRMQWADIKTAIGMNYCAGWGQDLAFAAPDASISLPTVRPSSASPSAPDVYDLGMGVPGGGHVGGCAPKRIAAATPQ